MNPERDQDSPVAGAGEAARRLRLVALPPRPARRPLSMKVRPETAFRRNRCNGELLAIPGGKRHKPPGHSGGRRPPPLFPDASRNSLLALP